MAKWSRFLIEFDAAADAANSYIGALEDGLSDEEALAFALDENAEALADLDDAPIAIAGLAISMAERGRLTAEIRARGNAALAELAERVADIPALHRTTAAATQLLNAAPLPRKRIVRRARMQTTLQPGDILALRHGGRTTLLRVARIDEGSGGRAPVLATLRWSGSFVPPRWALRSIPDRPIAVLEEVRESGGRQYAAGALVTPGVGRNADFHDAGFEVVGHVSRRRGDDQMAWTMMCQWPTAAELIRNGRWFTPRRTYDHE